MKAMAYRVQNFRFVSLLIQTKQYQQRLIGACFFLENKREKVIHELPS